MGAGRESGPDGYGRGEGMRRNVVKIEERGGEHERN